MEADFVTKKTFRFTILAASLFMLLYTLTALECYTISRVDKHTKI